MSLYPGLRGAIIKHMNIKRIYDCRASFVFVPVFLALLVLACGGLSGQVMAQVDEPSAENSVPSTEEKQKSPRLYPFAFQTPEKPIYEDETPEEEEAQSVLDALEGGGVLNGMFLEDPYAGQYAEGSPQNLSRLYWRLNVFPSADKGAVDNFMLINECGIYEDFYTDDFEWQRVRESAGKMLQDNRADFSKQFKFVMPVNLERYDHEKKGFPLSEDTDFKDMRRVEITGNSLLRSICGKRGRIDGYPRNIVIVLKRPFSYEFVSMDEDMAKAFVDLRNYERIKDKKYDRLAYLRLRVTFSSYQGTTRNRKGEDLAVLYADVDGVDLFEDHRERRLMATTDFRKVPDEDKDGAEESKTHDAE